MRRPWSELAERAIPDGALARDIHLQSSQLRLAQEQQRLERLGMLRQADAVRRERRYWQFVQAILELPPRASAPRP